MSGSAQGGGEQDGDAGAGGSTGGASVGGGDGSGVDPDEASIVVHYSAVETASPGRIYFRLWMENRTGVPKVCPYLWMTSPCAIGTPPRMSL